MDNYQGPIDFSELKKNMTAINDTDKEVLAQMARLVNEITRRRKVPG
ncbi:hypothetical protein [Paenibacillus sp. H1-7]|nr:hypothetical protein [Paenibacillus sp. H1-7]